LPFAVAVVLAVVVAVVLAVAFLVVIPEGNLLLSLHFIFAVSLSPFAAGRGPRKLRNSLTRPRYGRIPDEKPTSQD
jgi:hypothetical protein